MRLAQTQTSSSLKLRIRVAYRILISLHWMALAAVGQLTTHIAHYCVSEEELCKLDNSADIFNALSDLPGTIDDVEKLLEVRVHRIFGNTQCFVKYADAFNTVERKRECNSSGLPTSGLITNSELCHRLWYAIDCH